MKQTARLLVILACTLPARDLFARQEKVQMPRLEIPEITIVGKKAITLPFARKGEAENVERFQAPGPDSSMISERQKPDLPSGSYVQSMQRFRGIRAAAYARTGSFTLVQLSGRASYGDSSSSAHVGVGYGRTSGHVSGAGGREFSFDARGSHLVRTDNDWLKTLQLRGNAGVQRARYHLFGIPNASVERSRDEYGIEFGFSTPEQQAFQLHFAVATRGTAVTDHLGSSEVRTTAVSPKLSMAANSTHSSLSWLASLEFESTALAGPVVVESPSVVRLTAEMQTDLSESWNARFGGRYARGRDTDGTSRALFTPIARARWRVNDHAVISFWWDPKLRSTSFSEQLQAIPYLAQGVELKHSVSPVSLGAGLAYTRSSVTVSATASIIQHRSLPVPSTPARGVLVLDYADGNEVRFDAVVRSVLSERMSLLFGATMRQARERGMTKQLPMIPTFQLNGKADIELPYASVAWASVGYTGKQNADLLGTATVRPFVLLDAGITSTSLAPVSVSFEIRNLLNQSYEWWSGYRAPGINLRLSAGVSW